MCSSDLESAARLNSSPFRILDPTIVSKAKTTLSESVKLSIAHDTEGSEYSDATDDAECVEPALASYLLLFQLALNPQVRMA